jgi:hypothetical protein
MSSARVWCLMWLLLAATGAVACGEPPDKEMQQAQGAIAAAQAAGADTYARDEFAAAQDLLKRAHEAAAQRDYRLALNYALDSRERAQNAAREAADRKAAARVDADHALASLTAALEAAQAKLKTADRARVPARTLREARAAIADGATRVQEARTAFEQGDYAAVMTRAPGVNAQLAGASRDLDAALTGPGRRRR